MIDHVKFIHLIMKEIEKVETIYNYSSKLKSKATNIFGIFEFIDLTIWTQLKSRSCKKNSV